MKRPKALKDHLKHKGQIQHFHRLLKRVGLECAQQYATLVKLDLGTDGLPLVPEYDGEERNSVVVPALHVANPGPKVITIDPSSSPVEGSDLPPAPKPQPKAKAPAKPAPAPVKMTAKARFEASPQTYADVMRYADELKKEGMPEITVGTFGEVVGNPEPVAPKPDLRPRGMFGEIIGGDDAPHPAEAPVVDDTMVNGWPLETDGIVWALCPNPQLAVLKLPDGRTASIWRKQLPPKAIGVRVNCILDKKTGDPIFKAISMADFQGDVVAKAG